MEGFIPVVVFAFNEASFFSSSALNSSSLLLYQSGFLNQILKRNTEVIVSLIVDLDSFAGSFIVELFIETKILDQKVVFTYDDYFAWLVICRMNKLGQSYPYCCDREPRLF